MKSAGEGPKEYQFYKHEFDAAGERKSLNYKFNLEINNGIPLTKIAAILVARDLMEVLKNSNAAKELMRGSHYKIDLDKEFKLTINLISTDRIAQEPVLAATEDTSAGTDEISEVKDDTQAAEVLSETETEA